MDEGPPRRTEVHPTSCSRRCPMTYAARFALASLLLAAGAPALSAEPAIAKRIVQEDQAANLLRPRAWQPYEKGFLVAGRSLRLRQWPGCQVPTGPDADRGAESNPARTVRCRGLEQGSRRRRYGQQRLLFVPRPDEHRWHQRVGQNRPLQHRHPRLAAARSGHFAGEAGQASGFLHAHAWPRGKAWFRDPALRMVKAPPGACLFDGCSRCPRRGPPRRAFRCATWRPVRTFVRVPGHEVPNKKSVFEGETLGLRFQQRKTSYEDVTFFERL